MSRAAVTKPYCIAHRGASAEAPENTLRAFERALELGADGVELDAQVTRDGVAVVFHDATLTRLTGARGRVADRTLAELARLRVCREPIPTLADTLALIGKRALVQVEIKKGAPFASILRAIQRIGSAREIILASFEPDILREAAALAPKLPRMLIADAPTRGARLAGLLRKIKSLGACGLSMDYRAIKSAEFVGEVHRHGAQLWCWTVNDSRIMRRLQRFSVDAILSDDPAKLIRTLRRA